MTTIAHKLHSPLEGITGPPTTLAGWGKTITWNLGVGFKRIDAKYNDGINPVGCLHKGAQSIAFGYGEGTTLLANGAVECWGQNGGSNIPWTTGPEGKWVGFWEWRAPGGKYSLPTQKQLEAKPGKTRSQVEQLERELKTGFAFQNEEKLVPQRKDGIPALPGQVYYETGMVVTAENPTLGQEEGKTYIAIAPSVGSIPGTDGAKWKDVTDPSIKIPPVALFQKPFKDGTTAFLQYAYNLGLPVRAPQLKKVVSITMCGTHGGCLLDDGTIRMWGHGTRFGVFGTNLDDGYGPAAPKKGEPGRALREPPKRTQPFSGKIIGGTYITGDTIQGQVTLKNMSSQAGVVVGTTTLEAQCLEDGSTVSSKSSATEVVLSKPAKETVNGASILVANPENFMMKRLEGVAELHNQGSGTLAYTLGRMVTAAIRPSEIGLPFPFAHLEEPGNPKIKEADAREMGESSPIYPLTGTTAVSSTVFNLTGAEGKNLLKDKLVKFRSLPAGTKGVIVGPAYFIVKTTANSFEVSASKGGAAITITGEAVPTGTQMMAINEPAQGYPLSDEAIGSSSEFLADTLKTSPVLKNMTNQGSIVIGTKIAGPNIPNGTTVKAIINSKEIELNHNPETNATAELIKASNKVGAETFRVAEAANHGFTDGTLMMFSSLTAGTSPGEPTAGSGGGVQEFASYYVANATTNSFQLAVWAEETAPGVWLNGPLMQVIGHGLEPATTTVVPIEIQTKAQVEAKQNVIHEFNPGRNKILSITLDHPATETYDPSDKLRMQEIKFKLVGQSGPPTGGTFRVQMGGETGDLPYNITPVALQEALVALGNPVDVVLTSPGRWKIFHTTPTGEPRNVVDVTKNDLIPEATTIARPGFLSLRVQRPPREQGPWPVGEGPAKAAGWPITPIVPGDVRITQFITRGNGGNGFSLALTTNQDVPPKYRVLAWGSSSKGQVGQGGEIFGLEQYASKPQYVVGAGAATSLKGVTTEGATKVKITTSTGGLVAGMAVLAPGVFLGGTVITEVNNITEITVSNGAIKTEAAAPLDFKNVLEGIITVGTGEENGYAINEAHEVFIWGNLDEGLGQGRKTTGAKPKIKTSTATPEKVEGLPSSIGERPVAVTGTRNTAFVLLENGDVWSWGGNNRGELGRGPRFKADTNETKFLKNVTNVFGLVPEVHLYGPGISAGTKIVKLIGETIPPTGVAKEIELDTATKATTTGVTILGEGLKESTVPTKIPYLSNVTYIVAGRFHAGAVKSDGTFWVWGNNEFGEQGNGEAKRQKLGSGSKATSGKIGDSVFIPAQVPLGGKEVVQPSGLMAPVAMGEQNTFVLLKGNVPLPTGGYVKLIREGFGPAGEPRASVEMVWEAAAGLTEWKLAANVQADWWELAILEIEEEEFRELAKESVEPEKAEFEQEEERAHHELVELEIGGKELGGIFPAEPTPGVYRYVFKPEGGYVTENVGYSLSIQNPSKQWHGFFTETRSLWGSSYSL